VLLVGLPAAGASAVAEAVSVATGWPALDDVLLLQRTTGCTAAELVRLHGEPALRSAESDVLTLTLSVPPPLVAAVSSGVVLDERDRARLRAGGHVVWLRVSVATLLRRRARAGVRGRRDDEPEAVLHAMAAEREALLAETAHSVLDLDLLTTVQAARQVVAAVRGHGPAQAS
jgi:shikimate kinase